MGINDRQSALRGARAPQFDGGFVNRGVNNLTDIVKGAQKRDNDAKLLAEDRAYRGELLKDSNARADTIRNETNAINEGNRWLEANAKVLRDVELDERWGKTYTQTEANNKYNMRKEQNILSQERINSRMTTYMANGGKEEDFDIGDTYRKYNEEFEGEDGWSTLVPTYNMNEVAEIKVNKERLKNATNATNREKVNSQAEQILQSSMDVNGQTPEQQEVTAYNQNVLSKLAAEQAKQFIAPEYKESDAPLTYVELADVTAYMDNYDATTALTNGKAIRALESKIAANDREIYIRQQIDGPTWTGLFESDVDKKAAISTAEANNLTLYDKLATLQNTDTRDNERKAHISKIRKSAWDNTVGKEWIKGAKAREILKKQLAEDYKAKAASNKPAQLSKKQMANIVTQIAKPTHVQEILDKIDPGETVTPELIEAINRLGTNRVANVLGQRNTAQVKTAERELDKELADIKLESEKGLEIFKAILKDKYDNKSLSSKDAATLSLKLLESDIGFEEKAEISNRYGLNIKR